MVFIVTSNPCAPWRAELKIETIIRTKEIETIIRTKESLIEDMKM